MCLYILSMSIGMWLCVLPVLVWVYILFIAVRTCVKYIDNAPITNGFFFEAFTEPFVRN